MVKPESTLIRELADIAWDMGLKNISGELHDLAREKRDEENENE